MLFVQYSPTRRNIYHPGGIGLQFHNVLLGSSNIFIPDKVPPFVTKAFGLGGARHLGIPGSFADRKSALNVPTPARTKRGRRDRKLAEGKRKRERSARSRVLKIEKRLLAAARIRNARAPSFRVKESKVRQIKKRKRGRVTKPRKKRVRPTITRRKSKKKVTFQPVVVSGAFVPEPRPILSQLPRSRALKDDLAPKQGMGDRAPSVNAQIAANSLASLKPPVFNPNNALKHSTKSAARAIRGQVVKTTPNNSYRSSRNPQSSGGSRRIGTLSAPENTMTSSNHIAPRPALSAFRFPATQSF